MKQIKSYLISELTTGDDIKHDIKSGLDKVREELERVKSNSEIPLTLDETIISEIKGGLHSIRDEIRQLKSDSGRQLILDDMRTKIKTELHGINEQLEQAKSDAGKQVTLGDDIKNELKAELHNIQEQIRQIKFSAGLRIQKQYFKTGSCRVTFRFPKEAAPYAKTVAVIGDFNDWDKRGLLMKRAESGDFMLTMDLKSGGEYRFKYLIDDTRWENDRNADKYLASAHGQKDSVVVV
ncbi:MAG: hypothetical protein ABFR82_13890 [Nitrospirota bacterium]